LAACAAFSPLSPERASLLSARSPPLGRPNNLPEHVDEARILKSRPARRRSPSALLRPSTGAT
jgi:hypothetical protein